MWASSRMSSENRWLSFMLAALRIVRNERAVLPSLPTIRSEMLGCAGSSAGSGSTTSPPPSANTYTLTVTGTSGADVHTTTLTLIVH